MTDMVAQLAITAKLRYLKKKGVVDPNIDMFVGVLDNDIDAVRAALEAGADTTITDKQIIEAHKADLADFDPRASM